MAHTETRTIRRAGETFDRIYLFCPNGHEVVSAPAHTQLGERLAEGEYGSEACGVSTCDWSAL